MRATPSVMALNLCNLRGIIRLATYIATTVTLVVAGKRWFLMLAPLLVQRSCIASIAATKVATKGAGRAIELTVLARQHLCARPHAKLVESYLPKFS